MRAQALAETLLPRMWPEPLLATRLEAPALPVPKTLTEPLLELGKGHDVRELDIAEQVRQVSRHQLPDSLERLLLHQDDLGIGLDPVVNVGRGHVLSVAFTSRANL